MITETSAVGSDEIRSKWLESSVGMIKNLRADGVPITWDEVLARWRRRGPANEEFVGLIQRGRRQLAAEGG